MTMPTWSILPQSAELIAALAIEILLGFLRWNYNRRIGGVQHLTKLLGGRIIERSRCRFVLGFLQHPASVSIRR